MAVGDVAKELGRRWEVCTNKAKYEALAAKDKARYEQVTHYCLSLSGFQLVPSVLFLLLVGRQKGIWLVKTEWWGAGVVVCLEHGADLHMAQLMPLPLTLSCFNKIQIGFTFLVPARLGSPRKRAIKRVCVCMCVSGFHFVLAVS